MEEELLGKNILITGASSGIGKATAVLLSRRGANLWLLGRNSERLKQTSVACQNPSRHHFSSVDFESVDQVSNGLKSDYPFEKPLDGIFHAAGKAEVLPVKLLTNTRWDEIISSQLVPAFALAKLASNKRYFNAGGSIVFMSSVASRRGQAGMTLYGATRAAIGGLVKSLAVELSSKSIRVNEVVSGAITTEMHEAITKPLGASGITDYENKHLFGFGKTDDIANAVSFLMSDKSTWTTGTSLTIDGGYLAK